MRRTNQRKMAPITAFTSLLIYEPRRYYVTTWSFYIMQMMPEARMTVVRDFHSFQKALANERYEFSTIIINWDVLGGLGDGGEDRLAAIRAHKRYGETPVCIYSEQNEMAARHRFHVSEQRGVILAMGCPQPYAVLKALHGKVDQESQKLTRHDDMMSESEALFQEKKFDAAIAKLQSLELPKNLLVRKYILLLRCYLALKKLEHARSIFEDLVRVNVLSPSLIRLGSEIYKHLGNTEWSLQFAEIKLRAYPGVDSSVEYAKALVAHGRRDEAVDILQREAATSGRVKSGVYALLVELLGQNLDFDGLSELLKRWDCTVPEATAAELIKYALSVASSGNTSAAVMLVNMMLPFMSTDQSRASAYYYLGRVHLSGGAEFLAEAVNSFAQSLLLAAWSDRSAKALHVASSKARAAFARVDQKLVRRAITARMDEVRAQLRQTLPATMEYASKVYGMKARAKTSSPSRERVRLTARAKGIGLRSRPAS